MNRVINWIELENFKSFGGKVRITFPEGMNVIIGPNGSGKSNISDAICFVLGKSSKKELRAEKYQQFIFNGGKYGKPADYARVIISLNNLDKRFPINSNEIIISRRVDKDGRTTYRVNGERQVIDYVKTILKQGGIDPDGYNIILQGSIVKISDMTPKERQELIESISGISFYEDRKHKSELELKKVESRLKEVRIILAEKLKYMNELEDEKKVAEKYVELQGRLKIKRKSLLIKRRQNLEKEVSKIENEINKLNNEINKYKEEKNKLEENKEKLNKELEETNKKIEELGGERQIEISNKLNETKSRISNLDFLIKNYKNEIERIKNRKVELKEEKGRIEIEIKNKEKYISKINPEFEEIKNKINKLELEANKIKEFKKNRDKIINEISKVEIEIAKNEEILKKLDEIKNRQDERKEINEKLSEIKDYENDINKLVNELKEKRKELNSLLVKRIPIRIKKFDFKCNNLGRLEELCKVKQYEKAIDMVAGNKWDYIIVENIPSAKECIDELRKKKGGIFTFIPMNEIKEIKLIEKPNEAIGRITDFLEYDTKYDQLFKFLFGNIFIFKDIDSARKYINKYKIVTIDGEIINKFAITGGYKIGRHEIKLIQEKIEKLRKEIAETENKIEELRELDINNKRKKYELEAKLKEIPVFDEQSYNLLKEGLENLKKKREELKNNIPEVNEEKIEELNKLIDKRNNLELELKSTRRELENILYRDREKIEKLSKDLEKEKEKFEKQIEETNEKLKLKENLMRKLEDEISKFKGELKDLYKKRNEIFNEIKNIEKDELNLVNKINNVVKSSQDLFIDKARINSEIERLKEEENEFDVGVIEVKESEEKIKEEIEKIEEKIKNFGPVNMRALEVFNEVKNEYDELKQKFEKVITEREEIIKTIEEIEEKKRETFLETLNKISQNLNEIFNRISNGEAYLKTDEENPFEEGVNIEIKLAGKKVSSMRLLSGGEKSLVSLALILALQISDISPFYFLDEVDAALDKENSEKFAELLKEYSKDSQVIVISHNDAVMVLADHLYGISMDKKGISRIVSLEMPQ